MLWIFGLLYLVSCCVSDIRTGEISVRLSLVVSIAAIAEKKITGVYVISELLADIIPGIIAILFAWISGQTFGLGDGLMILTMGLVMGVSDVTAMTWYAFLAGGIYAGVLLFLKKKKKEEVFPFAPCMLAGYIAQGIGELCKK